MTFELEPTPKRPLLRRGTSRVPVGTRPELDKPPSLDDLIGPHPVHNTSPLFRFYASMVAGLTSGVAISFVLLFAGLSPVSNSPFLAAFFVSLTLAASGGVFAQLPGYLVARFALPSVALTETSAVCFITGLATTLLVFAVPLRNNLLVLLVVVLAGAAGGFAGGIALRQLEDNALSLRREKQRALIQENSVRRRESPVRFDG